MCTPDGDRDKLVFCRRSREILAPAFFFEVQDMPSGVLLTQKTGYVNRRSLVSNRENPYFCLHMAGEKAVHGVSLCV